MIKHSVKRFIVISAASAFLTGAFTGCGKSSYTMNTEGYASAAAEAMVADDDFELDAGYLYDAEAAAGSTGSADIIDQDTASSRKLITTVNMNVETEDLDTCISKIKAKTNAVGGYMEEESIYAKGCDFTARIPSASLSDFLEAVRANSNVTFYSSSVEDVTLNYVDIESRIDSLKTEQKRLDELLAGADTMEEIIALEGRMSEVRYELQSYESQRRTYDNKIDYSAVYINVSEVEVYTPEKKATAGERIKLGFADSANSLKNGLVEFFIGFISNLPMIIFWSLFFGGIFCAIFFPVRAHKRRKAKRRAAAGEQPKKGRKARKEKREEKQEAEQEVRQEEK